MSRYQHIFKLADEKEPEPPTPPEPPSPPGLQKSYKDDPEPDDDDDEKDPPDSLIEIIEQSISNYYNLTGEFEEALDNYQPLFYNDT